MRARAQLSAKGNSNDRYLAGLWTSTLVDDLFWQSRGKDNTRPDVYRAPSWPWASVDGPILYLDIDERVNLAELESFALKSTYGAWRSNVSLTLNVVLLAVPFDRYQADDRVGISEEWHKMNLHLRTPTHEDYYVHHWYIFDERSAIRSTELLFLPLVHLVRGCNSPMVMSLLAEQKSGPGTHANDRIGRDKTFMRCGRCDIRGEDAVNDWLNRIREARSEVVRLV